MKKNTPANTYMAASVETAPPLKIVRMLYEGAIRFISRAEDAGIETTEGSAWVGRADAIIKELRISLDPTRDVEVCEQLGGRAPDFHYIPVGNAGNITACWMGYRRFHERGLTDALPRMRGWQAEGAAPIVRGRVVENPETFASAIRIGNPASWKPALAAAEESGGRIDMVSDEEIQAAYRLLASAEGIFCEPASAASVAGLLKDAAAGRLPRDAEVVCTLTGHGLKDPDTVIRMSEKPATVEADVDVVVARVGLEGEPAGGRNRTEGAGEGGSR